MLDFGGKISHRGVFNNKDTCENSIKAFKKSIKLNIPIELDVQLTKDNVLVVFHDYNLSRMTGVNKKLQELTYQEIKDLKLLDTNDVIPTFREVIKIVNEKVLLNIEIKNTKRVNDTVEILFKELEGYNKNKYVLQSFNPYIVRYIKKNYPLINVGYLLNYKYPKKLYKKLLINNTMINYSKADFLSINKKLLKDKQFHKYLLKYPIFVWTINSTSEIKDLGITYICNNLPY